MELINSLLHERKHYPIGSNSNNNNQIDYILNQLAKDGTHSYLILPTSLLQRTNKDTVEIKKLIFEKKNISALIELGSIWHPITNINFTLIVLDSNEVKNIFICEKPKINLKSTRGVSSRTGSVDDIELNNEHLEYLRQINHYLTTNQIDDLKCSFIDASEFDKNKLYIHYYLEKYKILNERLARETTLPLSELAEIIVPKQSKHEGKVLKVSDFHYPLNINNLEQTDKLISSEKLLKGDVLISSIGKPKAYLVTEKLKKVYPRVGSFFILRVHSKKISPEFLFLFLQSDVGRNYILRNSYGLALNRLDKKSAKSFPIIIPKKQTLSTAKTVFKALYLEPNEDKLDKINNFLFTKQKSIDSPIQEEFVLELLANLKSTKLEKIKEIVEEDFKEVTHCINQKAYKATVILLGSILEAVLLDWLSEVNKKNYILSKNDITFFELIKEMEKSGIFDKKISRYAHTVRDYRNLVHPKKMLVEDIKLNNQIVKDMIWNLKEILKLREIL